MYIDEWAFKWRSTVVMSKTSGSVCEKAAHPSHSGTFNSCEVKHKSIQTRSWQHKDKQEVAELCVQTTVPARWSGTTFRHTNLEHEHSEEVNKFEFDTEDGMGEGLCVQSPHSSLSEALCCLANPQKRSVMNHWLL